MPEAVFLAVDPDQTVLAFVRRLVVSRGFEFLGARRGGDALKRAAERRPDAVVSRVTLPDMGAPEFVSRLRADAGSGAPPVLLTALRGQEAEASAGLEQGALNVLFFPFAEAELSARLGSLVRGSRRPAEGVLSVGGVAVDLEKGEILKPQPQPLTGSEVEILRWLLNPPGRAVTRRQFPVGTERAVDVHVASLRSKLGAESGCIETLRGIGYRFRVACTL